MKKTNKTFKRFAAITSASLLAACAIAPVAFNAFAAENEYVITVNAPTDSSVNAVKEVKAYKIFNLALGDLNEGVYGAYTYTVDDTCVLTADQLLNIDYVGTTEAPAKFTSIEALVSWIEGDKTGGNARIFADKVYTTYKTALASATSSTGTISDGVATIDTGSAGYYMVYGVGINKDGEPTDNKNTVISQIMLDSTDKTASINLKLDAPSLDKQIYHDEKQTWGDVGDNQIGENVEYKIITSVPNIAGYTDSDEKYKYVIHDSMTAGLSFNASSIKVYTDADCTQELATTYYSLATTKEHADCDFELVIDLNAAKAAGVLKADGTEMLYTRYNALLTSDALVADDAPDDENHNDNMAYLQYSNNPYSTIDGSQETGETPKVEVYDWTFSEKITKVTEENIGLAGAIFEVYTVDPESDGATPISFVKGDDESYTIDTKATDGAVTQITSVAAGGFVLRGLDDATTYYILEVKQPDGYAKLTAPKTFTLEAGYIAAVEGSAETPDNLQTLTDGDTTDGANEMKIVNTAGSALPGTGGIGTTIFYLGGGAMAAIGGVYLISKRRMKKSEE